MRLTMRYLLVLGVFGFSVEMLPISDKARAEDMDHAHDHNGYHGQGHAQWHDSFYKNLMIPGTKTSCCNLADCRSTQIRTNGDHYEIMKDGRWIRVPTEKIVKATAPDGGAHICAPDSASGRFEPDYVFCIIMPLET
jgi:hypothetical protein